MDWNYYKATVNDCVASIYLNLEAKEDCEEKKYSTLYWLFIRLKVERDDGLSHDDEFEMLCEFEDIIDNNIKDLPIELVGRITTKGMRQYYFYGIESLGFNSIVEAIVSREPSYQYQSGSKDDTSWSQYEEVLYPGKQGLKQMSERNENA